MTNDEFQIDELMRLVAAEIEASDIDLDHSPEAFLSWLAEDVGAAMNSTERAENERQASAFARRMSRRIASQKTERLLPQRELRYRSAPITLDVREALAEAARNGCATVLDLAVAAGVGRELWEESCDQWLELPPDVDASDRFLALKVAGDSMAPILNSRDVILLKLNASPRVNDLVVAKIPDNGYVVKYAASIENGRVELASFNTSYESVFVPLSRGAILGTVIARFRDM